MRTIAFMNAFTAILLLVLGKEAAAAVAMATACFAHIAALDDK